MPCEKNVAASFFMNCSHKCQLFFEMGAPGGISDEKQELENRRKGTMRGLRIWAKIHAATDLAATIDLLRIVPRP
jgi:hypothetical protein